jgi:hypothetical protein
MNSLEHRQKFRSTAAAERAEQRPTSQSSRSHFKKPSKSPGRGPPPQHLPPIGASDFEVPKEDAAAHTSTRNRDFERSEEEKENENSERKEELLGGEDGQDEALQALAAYAAFQLTLLRHIADDPTSIEFSDQDQTSVGAGKTFFHSSPLDEDFVPEAVLSTGKRPEARWERKMP